MDIKSIINYLFALQENNNREWYHANKEEFKKANAEFEDLLQALIEEVMTSHLIILHSARIFLLRGNCPSRLGII